MDTTRTPRPTSRRRTATAVAACVFGVLAVPSVVGAAPVAATAPAAPQATVTVDDEIGIRLNRACLRIPNLQIRTDNLLTRIEGDAETRGSLLWLEVQIERARTAGWDQLATVLENRLEVRRATVPVLRQRQEILVRLAEWCVELGVDL